MWASAPTMLCTCKVPPFLLFILYFTTPHQSLRDSFPEKREAFSFCNSYKKGLPEGSPFLVV